MLFPPPIPIRRGLAGGSRSRSFLRRPSPTSASSAIRAVPHEAYTVQGNSERRPRSAACQATAAATGSAVRLHGASTVIDGPSRSGRPHSAACQATVDAGGAAAAAAGNGRRPPPQLQQITRRNFRSALPEVASALQSCR